MDEQQSETTTSQVAEEKAQEIGERLKQARKKSKRSLADLAKDLHVSSSTLQSLETGEWRRLGPVVYARGYLSAYARLLEVDVTDAASALPDTDSLSAIPAELLRRQPRRNWAAYQRMATYLAATALIAIPAIWIGKAGFDRFLTPRVSVQPPPDAVRLGPQGSQSGQTDDQDADEPPAMASMAPVRSAMTEYDKPTLDEPSAPPVPADADGAPASSETAVESDDVESGHGLVLEFNGQAWLEVEDGDGERLAFGLMEPGSVRSFPLSSGLRVRIGNADEVIALIDDQPFDLAPHRSRDLAIFELPAESQEP